MKSFISRNASIFNESQLEALDKVADMQKKDLLLIQGPVSIYHVIIHRGFPFVILSKITKFSV